MKNAIRLALSAPGAASTAAPEWILLLPAGDITTRDGRLLRNVTPDTIIASFAGDQRDMPIDYEHATEVRAAQGLSAPAVGWINELKIEAGEVFGKVAWTDEGRAAVEGRSYRYISPVVHLEPGSRAVTRISSVALTNDPALYIKSLNRRDAPETQEETAMLKAIAKALNLAETATEAEILSAIAVQHSEKEQLRGKVDKPDAAKYVLRTEHDALITTCSQLRAEVKTLKDADTEKEITALVDGAISDGKVIPAIRESELELCRAVGADKYKERLSKLTAVLKPGEDDKTRVEPGKVAGKLDDAQKEMCRRLGLSEEEYLKDLPAA
ncbi:hypothetical protein ASD64_07125 [Mesorhizobium sp. Root157]|uniref:phage protease n=1 Tax=Mesorhizobium sp. Root157 TaxID=1736477 RepID=UPI0006F6D589|nr:phage protease [Mesorhizobium sp. Root157]KQZ87206.1 hypothetical protein ASD64_07125 [Mesorhizobium sp. Root157]